MSKQTMHWPDEAVNTQFILASEPEFSIPFGVHVFLFHTLTDLREACGDPLATAHSVTYKKTDSEGVGAIIMVAADCLELSLVIHECTHVALYWLGRNTNKKRRARDTLKNHGEDTPEFIGNLSALIWWNLHPRG